MEHKQRVGDTHLQPVIVSHSHGMRANRLLSGLCIQFIKPKFHYSKSGCKSRHGYVTEKFRISNQLDMSRWLRQNGNNREDDCQLYTSYQSLFSPLCAQSHVMMLTRPLGVKVETTEINFAILVEKGLNFWPRLQRKATTRLDTTDKRFAFIQFINMNSVKGLQGIFVSIRASKAAPKGVKK